MFSALLRSRHGSRARRKPTEPEIPTASFGDIAFLLIIFFLLATTLVQTRGITARMPSGEKSDAPADKTPSIQMKGETIIFNDKPLDIAGLRTELAALDLATRAEDDRVVLLETAAQVDYQAYFEVMTAVSRAGGVIALVREE